jgi:hypothetical protein
MPDDKAKQLCIIFNELSGTPDEVRLSELLRDIHGTTSMDEMLETMPYSMNEMDMYINAMDFSFDNLPEHSNKTPEEEKADNDNPHLKLAWEGDEAKALSLKLTAIAADPKKAVELCVAHYEKAEAARAVKASLKKEKEKASA